MKSGLIHKSMMSLPGQHVAYTAALLESMLLLAGDKIGLLATMLLPFRVVMFSVLLRCYVSEQQPSYLSWQWLLCVPYLVSLITHGSLSSEGIDSLGMLGYLSPLIAIPIFYIFLQQTLRFSSLGYAIELIGLLCLAVLLIALLFFQHTLLSFWRVPVADYVQTIAKMSQSSLSQADLLVMIDVASRTMTARMLILQVLTPILTASLIVMGMFRSRYQQVDVMWQHWISESMSWSTFCASALTFFVIYGCLLLESYFGVRVQGYWLNAVAGCFDLARFIASVFGLSYLHARFFQNAGASRITRSAYYGSVLLYAYFGSLFQTSLALIGLADKAICLRGQTLPKQPAPPSSST